MVESPRRHHDTRTKGPTATSTACGRYFSRPMSRPVRAAPILWSPCLGLSHVGLSARRFLRAGVAALKRVQAESFRQFLSPFGGYESGLSARSINDFSLEP